MVTYTHPTTEPQDRAGKGSASPGGPAEHLSEDARRKERQIAQDSPALRMNGAHGILCDDNHREGILQRRERQQSSLLSFSDSSMVRAGHTSKEAVGS